MQIGSKPISEMALMKFGVIPAMSGAVIGGSVGMVNGHYNNKDMPGVGMSTGIGAAVGGGIGALALIGVAKQSFSTTKFTKAQRQMASKLNLQGSPT